MLRLLTHPDSTLTLSEIHCRLEWCHRHLCDLHPRTWRRWSAMLFHFLREEILTLIQTALDVLKDKVQPEQLRASHRCLLQVHFRLVEPEVPTSR